MGNEETEPVACGWKHRRRKDGRSEGERMLRARAEPRQNQGAFEEFSFAGGRRRTLTWAASLVRCKTVLHGSPCILFVLPMSHTSISCFSCPQAACRLLSRIPRLHCPFDPPSSPSCLCSFVLSLSPGSDRWTCQYPASGTGSAAGRDQERAQDGTAKSQERGEPAATGGRPPSLLMRIGSVGTHGCHFKGEGGRQKAAQT